MQEQILQIERLIFGAINANENILFDSTVISKGNIGYDPSTGVITLNERGTYEFNWWVATKSTQATQGPIFALVSSQGDFIVGNSPIKTGEVVGFGVIEVTDTPVTVSLKNNHSTIIYDAPNLPVKASLTIVASTEQTSMTCFAMEQLAHIVQQMMVEYPATTWSLYPDTSSVFFGVPLDLYKAPGADGPWLMRFIDNNGDYLALSLGHINAFYPGDNTVWNPEFSFLPLPDPVPSGCDADAILGVLNYLPLGTGVNLVMGPDTSATGTVFRNEPGVLVLSSTGNNPVLISSLQIAQIFTVTDPTTLLIDNNNQKYKTPMIQTL